MNTFPKIIKANIYFLFIASISLDAENFLEVSPNKPTPTLTLMLTQNDKNFLKEMRKYPKNTAFFIDGKTEKIISTNIPHISQKPLPTKPPITQKIPIAAPQKTNDTPPKSKTHGISNPYIPYQMEEEIIELLR